MHGAKIDWNIYINYYKWICISRVICIGFGSWEKCTPLILPGNSIVCFEEFQRVPEWREVKGTDLRAFLTRFDLDHITESRKRRYQASCPLWAASRTEMTSLRELAVQLIITLPRSPVLYSLFMSSAQSANDSCTCPEHTHEQLLQTDTEMHTNYTTQLTN